LNQKTAKKRNKQNMKTVIAILFLLTVALTPPLQADPKTEKVVVVFGMS